MNIMQQSINPISKQLRKKKLQELYQNQSNEDIEVILKQDMFEESMFDLPKDIQNQSS